MRRARFAASIAAESHQAATQPREAEAGILAAWQHILKGSEDSRGRTLLSAVVELSVKPGHQAVTASVCPNIQLLTVAAGESDLLDISKISSHFVTFISVKQGMKGC